MHNVFTPHQTTAVYYDLIDHIGNTMEFYPPKMKHVNDLDYEIFNQMVEHAYVSKTDQKHWITANLECLHLKSNEKIFGLGLVDVPTIHGVL